MTKILTILLLFPLLSIGQILQPNPNIKRSSSPQPHMMTQQRMQIQQQQEKQIIEELYGKPQQSYMNQVEFQARMSYERSFDSLVQMIDRDSIDFKKAIYHVENAYYSETMPFNAFDNPIKELADLCRKLIKAKGYNIENNEVKNWAIQQVMKNNFTYDFEDFLAYEDYTNMFVSKLARTRKGQCHSLPLMYMLLAQELEAEAYMAHAPSHSYIMFKDNKGTWYNYETTNGNIVSNSFVKNSGFIKSEAILNEIFMRPLTQKELLATCMRDLAESYQQKFGYAKFVDDVLDKAIEYAPKNVTSLQLKADIMGLKFRYTARKV